ncbi:MAG: alpha/beta fold hydrolase [Paracoccaceae bacterium]
MPILIHADLRQFYHLVGPALSPGRVPVALIHGLGANLAFWYLGALRHMGSDRTVLLHDLRGHGASSMPDRGYGLGQMVEDFRGLLDHLGIARADVVGHSHGARVALLFALSYPERVASLTLADTQLRALQAPMTLGEWPHWPAWKSDLGQRGVTRFPPDEAVIDFKLLAELGPRSAGGRGGRSVVDLSPDGVKGRMGGGFSGGFAGGLAGGLAGGFSGGSGAARRLGGAGAGLAGGPGPGRRGAVGDGVGGGQRRIDLQSRQMGAHGAERWAALLERTEASAELQDESAIDLAALSGLTMPVLLLYGALSHCLPTSDRLLERMPQARRLLIPGGGHFFPIVKPQAFARALSVFLSGAGRGETGRGGRGASGAAAAPRPAPAGGLLAGRGARAAHLARRDG